MYANHLKRLLDLLLSLVALVVLSPVLLILTAVGAVAMRGNPFFVQPRPGRKDRSGRERVFHLIKFRTMSNKKDASGELLPDADRLGAYGRMLRKTSLDELPELVNILVGDMAIVGPRPQLVRDMVFMTAEQRRRHEVRPGLTGLAQINGRNALGWEQRFAYDLEYVNHCTFFMDLKIIGMTLGKVLKRSGTLSGADQTVADFDVYRREQNRNGEK